MNTLYDQGQTVAQSQNVASDQANRTQLSIFARWVSDVGAVELYMGLVNVQKTTSAAMMEAVSSFCRGKGIDMRDIRFVGLDGCNTMSGEHKAHLETLAQFYGTEQIDEFEGNRTVAPPELGCSVTVRNELEAFKPQLFMYKSVTMLGVDCCS
ncbi:hypothetical protein ACF0H5_010638 [Mactra antiquata]